MPCASWYLADPTRAKGTVISAVPKNDPASLAGRPRAGRVSGPTETTRQVPVNEDHAWFAGSGRPSFSSKAAGETVPVITGLKETPNLGKLKHFGAAAATSGGVEMYHIPGVTAEAQTLEQALGGRQPVLTVQYGPAEREAAYSRLNTTATDTDVDLVMIGCPHASLDQIRDVCDLLGDRKVAPGTELWVFTPRALKEVAYRSGYTEIIEAAGGHVLTDTCPAISRIMPKDTRVVATDSAKQAHYLPAITGVQAWFGSVADCVEAAVSGRRDLLRLGVDAGLDDAAILVGVHAGDGVEVPFDEGRSGAGGEVSAAIDIENANAAVSACKRSLVHLRQVVMPAGRLLGLRHCGP